MRHLVQTIAAAVVCIVTLPASGSASGICDRLGFELANIANRIGPGPEARKYGRAIVEQKRSLRELGQTRRRAGCSGGSLVVIGDDNKSECDRLDAKMARMERNLAILESKRIALLSESSSGLRRQRLAAALEENHCNDGPVYANASGDEPSVFPDPDDSSGLETIRVPASDPEYGRARFVDLGGESETGNIRTMCVRTCDGAFFPISSRASTSSFHRDAQVCSMMCPGTATELYYHSIHQESSDMRSTITGLRYEEMDNAYRFRVSSAAREASCSCNFSLYYREMMRREAYISDPKTMKTKDSAIVWVKPALRGDVETKVEERIAASIPKDRPYVPDSSIRMIGPRFLPDEGLDFTRTSGE